MITASHGITMSSLHWCGRMLDARGVVTFSLLVAIEANAQNPVWYSRSLVILNSSLWKRFPSVRRPNVDEKPTTLSSSCA